jgi:hypothetical protein
MDNFRAVKSLVDERFDTAARPHPKPSNPVKLMKKTTKRTNPTITEK